MQMIRRYKISTARAQAEVSGGGDLKTPFQNPRKSALGVSFYFRPDGQPRQTMVTLRQEKDQIERRQA